jgi:hypothetical protein
MNVLKTGSGNLRDRPNAVHRVLRALLACCMEEGPGGSRKAAKHCAVINARPPSARSFAAKQSCCRAEYRVQKRLQWCPTSPASRQGSVLFCIRPRPRPNPTQPGPCPCLVLQILPQISLYKKKISCHIKMSVNAWSIKC